MEKSKNEILTDSISNLELNNFNNGIIQDNKLIFIVEDKSYRVRMPIQSEQALVDQKRNLMQLEYINQEGCITRKQLIYKLKESGLYDIEKVEERKEELTREIKQLWFLLATKSTEPTISELKVKINKIQNELKDIAIESATQLAPSLESRLEKFTVEYTTYLCTDVQKNKEWFRVWEIFEDYQKEGSELTDKAAANLTWLLLNRRN